MPYGRYQGDGMSEDVPHLAFCGRNPLIAAPDNTGCRANCVRAFPDMAAALYTGFHSSFSFGAKRSFPASSVKLYVGFVQDAEHAASAAEARLLENLVDGESFKIHIDHTLVALGTAHRLVADALDMFLDPAFMTRGLADGVGLLREQGDGCKHVAGPRFREQLVTRIYPVMYGYQPYVHQSAELQKKTSCLAPRNAFDSLGMTTVSPNWIRAMRLSHCVLALSPTTVPHAQSPHIRSSPSIRCRPRSLHNREPSLYILFLPSYERV